MDQSLRIAAGDVVATPSGEWVSNDWQLELQALVDEWLDDCVVGSGLRPDAVEGTFETSETEAPLVDQESALRDPIVPVADSEPGCPDVVAAAADEAPACQDADASFATAPLVTFRERLRCAQPAAGMASRMDWTRLLAVVSSEEMDEQEEPSVGELSQTVGRSGKPRRPKGRCVEVNSEGTVFFGVLAPAPGEAQEEAVAFKFCNSRHRRQSEQMAAELAWHLEVTAPVSRLLLRVHDEEWQDLKDVAEALCPELGELLTTKQSLLIMQFIPGKNHAEEQDAWTTTQLAASANSLGRLLVLDILLGNADRLPMRSLAWRGNPSNVLWSSCDQGGRCAPIDALVARRPPRLKVQREDDQIRRVLELILLDAESAQGVLLEATACNKRAVEALEADWEARQKERAERGAKGENGADPPFQPSVNAVRAFHDGLQSALALALREQGLLEMIADVLQSWFDTFHADMSQASAGGNWKSRTSEIFQLSREADTNDLVRERWSAWQTVMQEKSVALLQAAEAWATERGVPTFLSFKGFLGDSVINPIVDVYELLVRCKQLITRIKVMASASHATRPADLSPFPLLVGPATAASCFHLMRKLGVRCLVNCTNDLLEPSRAELGKDIVWHRVPLDDSEDQDLSIAAEEGLRFIDAAVKKGGRVLLHCHEGKSRSVALCLAYLVTRERRSLADALAHVKSRRPQARPNAGFWTQLVALELATLGSSSVTPADAPKGKPKGFVCEICGETAGLTEEALVAHMKRKHGKDDAAN